MTTPDYKILFNVSPDGRVIFAPGVDPAAVVSQLLTALQVEQNEVARLQKLISNEVRGLMRGFGDSIARALDVLDRATYVENESPIIVRVPHNGFNGDGGGGGDAN